MNDERERRTLNLPNLLIIGAQKCGTTWLHHALNKSEHFWGSKPKELNFWNRNFDDLEDYARHFENASPSADFWYESTPHYFRLPKHDVDVAARIRESLGDIPLILLLRNPVDRYLSAYTHHMMKSRLPVVEKITEVSQDRNLLNFGDYYPILRHYKPLFSTINIYLHDEIVTSPHVVVSRIFSDLGVQCDITPADLDFRSNDKKKKQMKFGRSGQDFATLPELSPEVRQELKDYYRESVTKLQSEFGLNVGSWVA